MRSRYTAFAVGADGDPRAESHLFRTWHPRTRPTGQILDPRVTWTSLRILRRSGGAPGESSGVVEFVVSFVDEGGRPGRMQETSRFARRGGRWLYVDGGAADDGIAALTACEN